jgi:hypothetical protein
MTKLHKKFFLMLFVLAIAVLSLPLGSREQTTKFYGVNYMELPKACGKKLNQNSACGVCIRVQGVAVTKYASCGHVCVKLPDRLTPDSVVLIASGAEGSNTVTGAYRK